MPSEVLYLRKFEKASGDDSGGNVGSLNEKKRGEKPRDTGVTKSPILAL
jgi:hypothetical protein